MLRLEKNVPLPSRVRTELGTALRAMEVGESFVVAERPTGKTLGAIGSRKFATRAVDGGFRVWRTE